MKNFFDEPNLDAATAADLHHWIRGTDVQQIWRKYGWTPPSEYRRDFHENIYNAKRPIQSACEIS